MTGLRQALAGYLDLRRGMGFKLDRDARLLAAPATVDVGAGRARPGAIEVPLVADVVELMLLTSEPATVAVRAHIAVRADEQLIQVDLSLTSVNDDDTVGDPATAQVSLDGLASALGASVHVDFSERQWQVRLAVPR